MSEENEKPAIDDNQKALLKQWSERIERALKKNKDDDVEKNYKELRAYVRGDVGDDGEKGLVRTNIIHSNFAAIIPQIYAKNPEIAVSPSEAAGNSEEWVPGFCKTLQSVLTRVFIKDANLKPRVKGSIRSAMTTSVGWTKVSWQKDVRTDPIITNRINDTQDNIQRIRMLIEEINEGDDSRCELEAKQAELEQQLTALQEQAEISAYSGIAIDRVLSEDIFILDDTLYDFDQYVQGEAIAHRVWMTTEQYKQQFSKDCPEKATRYGVDKKQDSTRKEEDSVQLVAVFEIWHKNSNTIYTLCVGADDWSRAPYVPQPSGKRFYPFFGLAFNPVDGRIQPLSDAELLKELQDEYNTTRTNFAEHRKENLPVRVYRKGGDLTDSDVNALANRQANQWVGIEGDPSQPIEKDIAILPNIPVDPSTYDVSPILRDAEMVLGAGDASKGTINKAKTATEAEIMAQGLQSRVAERQDVVEDWIAEMANYAAELCLQELSLAQVQRIAGQDAVWPQMNKEQIFDLVNIEIRAGSAGRPNKAKEREQWGQMLPQIQQAITQIMELRKNAQEDMAETVMKLLEETLRRFDERIDIESFLPPKKEGEEKAPTIPPELQQQMQQMQEMLQQLQAQNQELQQKASANDQKMAFEREKFGFEQKKHDDLMQLQRDQASAAEETKRMVESERITSKETIESNKLISAQIAANRDKYLMNPELLTQEAQEQASTNQAIVSAVSGLAETMQRMMEMTSQGRDEQINIQAQIAQSIINAVAESGRTTAETVANQLAQVMNSMQSTMSKPRKFVYDESGNIVGAEVAQ